MKSDSVSVAPFTAPFAPDDGAIAAELLAAARLEPEQEKRIDQTATRLVEAIRTNDDPLGGVEDMLREFALSTREGLALMVLAEALLRVPDARTADRFIEDKLGEGDFIHHETKSSAFLVNASAWALGMSARVIQPGETPRKLPAGLPSWAVNAWRCRHASGDALADGQPFRAWRNDRGGAGPRAVAAHARPRYDLRHAGRRRAHRRGCRSATFNSYGQRDRRDRRSARAAVPLPELARHLRRNFSRAASAVRGGEPGPCRWRELVLRLIQLAQRAREEP